MDASQVHKALGSIQRAPQKKEKGKRRLKKKKSKPKTKNILKSKKDPQKDE